MTEVEIALALVVGAMVGSFLNVVIHRLPRMLEARWRSECALLRGENPDPVPTYNLAVPASACPHCARGIRWHENIPLLSYALLRGRCRGCGAPISVRYPLVEAAAALITAFTVWHFGPTSTALAALILAWCGIALSVIDYDTQLLPDDITLPLIWLGLLWNLIGGFTPLADAVIGAVAGYLILWTVYQLFKLLTGKEGMGYGDFKLLAAYGAWLGWGMLPLVLLASSLVGALVGIGMIVIAGHDRAKPIPFGPYLVMGGMIALYWGKAINTAYFGS
jgi:leader peptidase (prepilin peptidase)/N-methyltransferase